MSLTRNAQFRLAALLFGTVPAMFVGVLLTVASVPSHAQSLTTATLTDLDNGPIPPAGNLVTEKEKI